VTINTYAIKTVLLAVTAAASFAAAIIVGMGLGGGLAGSSKTDIHQVISCETGAAASPSPATSVRSVIPNAVC
jgi:hypothetical protein